MITRNALILHSLEIYANQRIGKRKIEHRDIDLDSTVLRRQLIHTVFLLHHLISRKYRRKSDIVIRIKYIVGRRGYMLDTIRTAEKNVFPVNGIRRIGRKRGIKSLIMI